MNKLLKKQFNNLRREYGESVFRCAIQQLIEAGRRHFTPEAVENSITQMRQEEDERLKNKSGGFPIMTVKFKIAIVECSAKLAVFETWDFLRYVKESLEFD